MESLSLALGLDLLDNMLSDILAQFYFWIDFKILNIKILLISQHISTEKDIVIDWGVYNFLVMVMVFPPSSTWILAMMSRDLEF